MTSNNDKASQADGICLECSYLAGKVYKMCLNCFEASQEQERASSAIFEDWLREYVHTDGLKAAESLRPTGQHMEWIRAAFPAGVASVAQDRDGVGDKPALRKIQFGFDERFYESLESIERKLGYEVEEITVKDSTTGESRVLLVRKDAESPVTLKERQPKEEGR